LRGGRTILVVDDDPFTLRMMDRALTGRSHEVVVTTDPAEALRIVDARGDDLGLVVLDVVMPSMMGPELGRQIALRRPHLPQLFISGFAPQPVSNEGSVEFLQKPFSSGELLGRVESMLGEMAQAERAR